MNETSLKLLEHQIDLTERMIDRMQRLLHKIEKDDKEKETDIHGKDVHKE